jgi:16S rRNA (guanine966-N2)-methyltransferase
LMRQLRAYPSYSRLGFGDLFARLLRAEAQARPESRTGLIISNFPSGELFPIWQTNCRLIACAGPECNRFQAENLENRDENSPMRILAGEAKGRVLKSREGKGTRPTDSRAREALFNIIGERVINARVLDLYAGSGAVGLEALSRGGASCVFVEQNAAAVRAIRENLRVFGWMEKAQVWQATVKAALHRLRGSDARFDIIFADPPFTREDELKELAKALNESAALLHNQDGRFGGLLIIQHHRKARPRLASCFEAVQQRRSGESLLSFYHVVVGDQES